MNNRIYVGNVSWTATTEDLTEAFSFYGAVKEAKIITDKETGKSRGFAFVTFEDEKAATSAVADFNGREIAGRAVKVSIAEERQPNSVRGGHYSRDRETYHRH